MSEYNQVTQLLIEARKLIDSPDKWAKGAYARSAKGRATLVLSKKAVCYCSEGALHKVDSFEPLKQFGFLPVSAAAFSLLTASCPNNTNIVDYNDHPNTTHEEIMLVWDKAIEKSKSLNVI